MNDPLIYPIIFMQMFFEKLQASVAITEKKAMNSKSWAYRFIQAIPVAKKAKVIVIAFGLSLNFGDWPPAWLHPI